MKTSAGHLTYCTNIHAGKNWEEDFQHLKTYFPLVKASVSKDAPMGMGLRLSNAASLELINGEKLEVFKLWLEAQNAYVFTLNGFPYGDFHHTVVKDAVHHPDWTTVERYDYTVRLIDILAQLINEGMEGGISTSPLSYRHWFTSTEDLDIATIKATHQIMRIVGYLVHLNRKTGQVIHLDLEPEPDGLIETGQEYITWYQDHLLRLGGPYLVSEFGISSEEAASLIKKHLRLCYDVCHFSIGFEDHEQVLDQLQAQGLQVGKIQISAALKAKTDEHCSRQEIKETLALFDEPTYLHQVVARGAEGQLKRYPDLKHALDEIENPNFKEWRAHFHVPISASHFGHLYSTQEDILTVLKIQKRLAFTNHLEVETYTWEVLPEGLKIPIAQSISDELKWVIKNALL